MTKVKILVLLMSISSFVVAQNIEWVKGFGGENSDYNTDISISSTGNIYTIGYFLGDFAFSSDTPLVPATEAWGTLSTFIKKDNENGELLWGKIIQSDNANYERVISQNIVIDSDDNLYISGYFSGEVDFDPGMGISLQNAGQDHKGLFILKLDSDGNFIWVKTFSITGVGLYTFINGISFDENGFLNLVGTYNETIDFGDGNQLPYVENEDQAIFIAKLNLSGELIFLKKLSKKGTQCNAHSVTTDSFEAIYISGSFNGALNFDPSEIDSTIITSNENNRDMYILKLSDEGNFSWVKTYSGGKSSYFSSRIKSDIANHIYICGAYRGKTNFGTIDLPDFHTAEERKDIYVQKMDLDGQVSWTTTFGGEYDDEAFDLGIDENGGIYLTGHYHSYSDFRGAYSDAFVSKLDKDGNILWSNAMHPSHFATGKGIFVKDANHIVASGYFELDLEVHAVSETTTLTSYSAVDCFVLKVEAQNESNSINVIKNASFNIFPNPSTNEIIIENKNLIKNILAIEIYSYNGKLVYSSRINTTLYHKPIDVSSFASGVYNVIIHCSNSDDVVKPFIKN